MILSVCHSLLTVTAIYMTVMLHFTKANPWKELVVSNGLNPISVNAYRINDILIHAQFAGDLPLNKDKLSTELPENVAGEMSKKIETHLKVSSSVILADMESVLGELKGIAENMEEIAPKQGTIAALLKRKIPTYEDYDKNASISWLQKVYQLAKCLRHITKYRILKSFGEIAKMVRRAKLGIVGEIGRVLVQPYIGSAALISETKQWENANKNDALIANKDKAEALNKRLKTFDKKVAEVRVILQKLSVAVMEAYPERKLKKGNEKVKLKAGKETIERNKLPPFEHCKEGRQPYLAFVNELAKLDLNALKGEISFKPVAGRANSLNGRKEFLKKFSSHNYITEYETGKAQPVRAALAHVQKYVENASQLIDIYANPIEAGNSDIECYNVLVDELRAAVYYGVQPAMSMLYFELQKTHVQLGLAASDVANGVRWVSDYFKSKVEKASDEESNPTEQNEGTEATNEPKPKAQ
ncbi:hypothetical protein Ddc_15421 [Ditylenchus destructor]|nr:hypothetical protein Ddc_15421 [Ditylenchus destructor]